MPKVSVIIPVYNVEKYLSECLDSVVNQTLKDIEIICVNDGSLDGSAEILEEYAQKDNRIKVITQENRGVSEARNSGLKIASGEYIAFLDSDDYIDLKFFEQLYKRGIESNSDVVVCENIYRFSGNKQKLFLKVNKEVETTVLKEKFECLYLPEYCYVWNKIYKRECLTERFLKGITFEDIYFTLNALKQCQKLSVAAGVSYYYRIVSNSIVNTPSNKNKYFYHKAFAYFYNFVCENKIDLDVNSYTAEKRYKLFGCTILKIQRKYFKTKYYLFNIIRWPMLNGAKLSANFNKNDVNLIKLFTNGGHNA